MSDTEPEEISRVIRVVYGDLLTQPVEVIVNPWNQNPLPYWLLLPQGVSGALLREAGPEPFRELAEEGRLKLGEAAISGPGRLKHYKGIIHVVAVDAFFRASEQSVRESARSAMNLVNRLGFASVAFPLLGAGVGGLSPEESYTYLRETLVETPTDAYIRIVRYRKQEKEKGR